MSQMPKQHPHTVKPAHTPARAAQSGELVKRGVSAVLLGGLALAAVWFGSPAFTIVVIAVSIVMSWEWGRVVRGGDFDATMVAHAIGVTAATILADKSHIGWAIAVLVASGAIVFVRQAAVRPWLSAMGLAYVGLPAMALVWLRGEPGHGFLAVAFVFATVWAHDTFAMLVGKAVGGPRLWPALSPNKTWAGFAGGMVAAAAIGWATDAIVGGTHPFGLALIGITLGLSASAGDLLESGLKRRYGVKNASGLIPGHGGFLDRMDGIVTASMTAIIVALLLNSARPVDGLLLLQ